MDTTVVPVAPAPVTVTVRGIVRNGSVHVLVRLYSLVDLVVSVWLTISSVFCSAFSYSFLFACVYSAVFAVLDSPVGIHIPGSGIH